MWYICGDEISKLQEGIHLPLNSLEIHAHEILDCDAVHCEFQIAPRHVIMRAQGYSREAREEIEYNEITRERKENVAGWLRNYQRTVRDVERVPVRRTVIEEIPQGEPVEIHARWFSAIYNDIWPDPPGSKYHTLPVNFAENIANAAEKLLGPETLEEHAVLAENASAD